MTKNKIDYKNDYYSPHIIKNYYQKSKIVLKKKKIFFEEDEIKNDPIKNFSWEYYHFPAPKAFRCINGDWYAK